MSNLVCNRTKNPICICSNDWHIDESNLGEIPGLISQKIELAKEYAVDTLICLGDVFQSRKAQKEAVLNCFKSILDEIHRNGMILYAIPGNHDKTDYSSHSSFLDPFSPHPALRLITTTSRVLLNSIECYFIPFFEEQMWLEEFKKITDTYKILFSHIAVNGSVNNNRTKIESTITPSLFKGKRVFLGHYHNYQDVTPNIHHLPSLKQNNFGEDTNKGFTVIYDDCSFDIANSEFKLYLNYSVRVDSPEFKELMKNYSKEAQFHYVKVKILGPQSEIKGVDLDQYRALGVKIDTVFDELIVGEVKQIDLSDTNTILDHFQIFCQENDLDLETGLNYLKQVL